MAFPQTTVENGGWNWACPPSNPEGLTPRSPVACSQNPTVPQLSLGLAGPEDLPFQQVPREAGRCGLDPSHTAVAWTLLRVGTDSRAGRVAGEGLPHAGWWCSA